MSAILPQNEEEFLLVSGVGPVKLKKYGRPFLTKISEIKKTEFIQFFFYFVNLFFS